MITRLANLSLHFWRTKSFLLPGEYQAAQDTAGQVFRGRSGSISYIRAALDLGSEDKHLIAPSGQSAKFECVREIGTVSQDTEAFSRQMFNGVPGQGPLSQNGKSRSIESFSGRLRLS
jgi:hypothetical protein